MKYLFLVLSKNIFTCIFSVKYKRLTKININIEWKYKYKFKNLKYINVKYKQNIRINIE